MFGYVTINKPEMKFKEFDIYHGYYCGLCHTLKKQFGNITRLTLNNDLTFIAILLSSLYEVETKKEKSRCLLHPVHQYEKYFNECIDYCAKMTIVLTYFKCQDDWIDEKKRDKQLFMKILSSNFHKIKIQYEDKVNKIEKYLNEIHICEEKKDFNLDEIANYSGYMMAEICTYKNDIWYDDLYEFGFYLGKFIYFMDAYDDIERDIKKKCFNPFIHLYNEDNFDDRCFEILEMMISKATVAFECLPIIENSEILRNILYSGVWSRFELIKRNRKGNE